MLRRRVTFVIRFVGFLAAVMLLPFVIARIRLAVIALEAYPGNTSYWTDAVRNLSYIVWEVIAIYCFLSGRFVIERIMRGLENRCPKCNYDLTGIRADTCP